MSRLVTGIGEESHLSALVTPSPIDLAQEKAAALIEAGPYFRKYFDATFVVKYGGSFMDSEDPAERTRVARDVAVLECYGINPVVVHGGGKAISRALEEAGINASWISGERVTSEEAVNVVERVLSKEINPEIVAAINSVENARARGFSGADIFRCQAKNPSLGYVGQITSVNVEPILDCINNHITPVISPTARGEDGQIYNCNADFAAQAMAISLQEAREDVKRLVYMSDVPGVMIDPSDHSSLLSTISLPEVDRLIEEGIINGGMTPKMRSASEAIRHGVEKVALIDGRVKHALLLEIFTDRGVGTLIGGSS